MIGLYAIVLGAPPDVEGARGEAVRAIPLDGFMAVAGDAPPEYLIAPQWCLDKPGLLRAIHAELERRNSWQGYSWSGSERHSPGLHSGNVRQPLPIIG